MTVQRIVSLVPSDTYTLLRLGAGPRVVGRTEYCVEPADEVASIAVVGGTKNVDTAKVLQLAPDLVVANREENRQKDIEQLQAAGVDVLLSFPKTVFEGLQHARLLDARLGGRNVELLDAMQLRYDALAQRRGRPVPCFVPIWMDPLMTVSGDTFISSALEIAGARNVFSDRERRYPLRADLGQGPAAAPEAVAGRDTRYPRVTLDEVVARGPALVLLPDEPHEFCQADAEVFRALAIPAAKHEQIHFCDGKDLMWYGLRTLEGLTRIAERVDDGRRALLG